MSDQPQKNLPEQLKVELDKVFITRFVRTFIPIFVFSLLFNVSQVKNVQDLSFTFLFSTICSAIPATFKLLRETIPVDHPLYPWFDKLPL